MLRVPVIACLAIVAAAGCRPTADEQVPEGELQPPAAEPAQPAPPMPAIGDAEVAHIAVTANEIDVEMGELALVRSQNAEVRAFAQRMVTDHTQANERAGELAGRLGVTPSDNDVSRTLLSDAEAVRARLQGMDGAAFDRAYIEHEVTYHQRVLASIDDVLIPSARNAELRGLVEEIRPVIVSHLEHARSLQRAVASL